jgi:anti-anti-sigma regulatory factor
VIRIWKDPIKRQMERAQLRSLKATRRRRAWLKSKRKSQLGSSKRAREFNAAKQTAIPVIAPKKLSVKQFPDEIFKFITKIKSIKDNPRATSAFIDLEGCTYISSGAIALMISAIKELKIYGVTVSGSYPTDPATKSTLEKSGFFNFVIGKVADENKVTLNTILQQGVATVDPKLVAPLILKATNFVWGKPYRNQRLQSLIVELMANTVNHAFKKTKNSKWFLSVNFNEVEKKVSFTFIDNGKGILNTLNLKFKTLIQSLLLGSNEDILIEAFNGKFGSRTKQKKRGRGLPNVKRCFKENFIRNLVVISNDVYLDFENNKTRKLKNVFDGTCYYWEIDINCEQWKIL